MNENEANFSISDSDKVVKAKPWEGDAVTDDEVIEIELPSSSGKRSSYEVPLTEGNNDSSSITGANLLKDVVKSKEKAWNFLVPKRLDLAMKQIEDKFV